MSPSILTPTVAKSRYLGKSTGKGKHKVVVPLNILATASNLCLRQLLSGVSVFNRLNIWAFPSIHFSPLVNVQHPQEIARGGKEMGTLT